MRVNFNPWLKNRHPRRRRTCGNPPHDRDLFLADNPAGAATMGIDGQPGYTRSMTKNLLIDAAIVVAIVLLGVAGHALAPLLKARTDIVLPLSGCDLNRQACAATLPDGGELEFSVEPRPIPILKPLTLRASFRNGAARRVEVDFNGSQMEMGDNRQPLHAQDDSATFVGQANLPICTTGRMEWQATVTVDTGTSVVAVPFRFATGH